MRSQVWFPTSLGGSGDYTHFFDGLPTWKQPEYFELVYAGAIGFILEDFIHLLVKPRTKNFSEMLLHHLATATLLWFSYFSNTGCIGIVIFYLHGLADICIAGTRSFSDIKNSNIARVFFGSLLICWPYTRSYVFFFIIGETYRMDFVKLGLPFQDPVLPQIILCSLVSILYVLHIFWYTQMLKVAYRLVFKGETEDISVSAGSMDKKG